MEDFEFSVEISDRDWECFFAECEECNMLPPALAGLDSGMSDFDEMSPQYAKVNQRADLTAGILGADCPIDDPPDWEGPPVERYLSKHGGGGLESVLSGSEEDIHLQSVNIFFEGLRGLPETQKANELSQVRGGKKRLAGADHEQCGDGQLSRGDALPENIPVSSSASARGETAVSGGPGCSVVAIGNTNTMKLAEAGTDISPDTAALKSVLQNNTPANLETEVLIREETIAEQHRLHGLTQCSQVNEMASSDTQHIDTTMDICMCATSSITPNEMCNICSNGKSEMATNVKQKGKQAPVLHLDLTCVNTPPSQESSPSASMKRKRRRKRRLSCEPAEGAQGLERRLSGRPSDSEEELFTGRGGARPLFSEDSFHFSPTQKNTALAEVKPITGSVLHSAVSDDPTVGLSPNDNQSQAKSVLAADAGNSAGDQSTQCPQHRLETRHSDANLSLKNSGHVTSPETPLCVSNTFSSSDTVQETECPLEVPVLSRLDQFAEKSHGNPNTCVEDVQLSTSNTFPTTLSSIGTALSDITTVSSLLTGSVSSLSNENITDLSGSFCSSVGFTESGGQAETYPLIKSQPTQHLYDTLVGEEEEKETSQHTVFAMSSFWRDIEKLTINDILGVRGSSKASPLHSLPPLPEMQEMNVTDSGFFTQPDEPKLMESGEPSIVDPPDQEESTSEATSVSSCSSSLWASERMTMSIGTDLCSDDIMSTSLKDVPPPVPSGNIQQGLRKISKSVHHLPDLAPGESLSSTWIQPQINDLDQVESKCGITLSKAAMEESSPSSLIDSYRISVSDIFKSLFGKKESLPSQSTSDNTTISCYSAGNCVSESYDHFFSEYDTNSLFCPFVTDEDGPRDEQVPIFSYSRLTHQNIQFPEVYDGFFPSSSSDDSSVESDEEDLRGPVRVVTRFSCKDTSSQITTDVYDDFFTDKDLKQNLFWNATLSFRNMNLSGFMVQKQALPRSQTAPVPLRPIVRSPVRTLHPCNADVIFPDPLRFHLKERISRQQTIRMIAFDDLQVAVSNPRMDSLFLSLRQSDMCLVCIAFASWVLKTANPEAGDAWKAVLLANVSALSAIRYLRKYVRKEAASPLR